MYFPKFGLADTSVHRLHQVGFFDEGTGEGFIESRQGKTVMPLISKKCS